MNGKERTMTLMQGNRDQILGCIFGGAIGDALGYPVEFMDEAEIFATYGPEGITELELDKESGKALISDDTQMTLFTANGLLSGESAGKMRKSHWKPRNAVAAAYWDWLATQKYASHGIRPEFDEIEGNVCWLVYVPELYNLRAPGNTCLSALNERGENLDLIEDYIASRINDSKGCGGVMRVAPLALKFHGNIKWLDKEGAQLAAITHGNSLGYMSAAVFVHIINRLAYNDNDMSLLEIVEDAKNTVAELFSDDPQIDDLVKIIDKAVELSTNGKDDLENIHDLGQGWVGEEALAISIYCSLKYQPDMIKGICVSVNHAGDSDSTGSLTGQILGTLFGYNAIPKSWLNNLELHDVIMELSNDLYEGCHMQASSSFYDMEWERKYSENKW